MKMRNNKIKIYLLLHFILLLYSMTSIFSKKAAGTEFLSIQFCFYYGMVILLLGLYAIGWQQIIKKLPLTTAFSNKAVTVFWGLIWGLLFFQEKITLGKIIGVIFVIVGVVLFSFADQESLNE